ncbi:MAG: hypothetical protein JWQ66_2819 [Mucilaginibacter sp.]|nr:hypothetical protein [Mucilaginibacter sp.]
MAYFRKKLERRTYSQDRYYILIKRQKAGKATFKELTELDEIVNRVPDIRDIVIRESFMPDDTQDTDTPLDLPGQNGNLLPQPIQHHTFWSRLRGFISRVFTVKISAINERDLAAFF